MNEVNVGDQADRARLQLLELLVSRDVELHLNKIASLFVTEVRLTLIVRLPGNNDADIVFTVDDLNEVKKVIERRIKPKGEAK